MRAALAASVEKQMRFQIIAQLGNCCESYLGFDDMPVPHLNSSAAGGGGFGVVSDHDDGLIEAII